MRYKGTVWVRVGPRRARASEADEKVLSERRAARQLTWDARPNREARLDDLALDLYVISYRPFAVSREVLAENHRGLDEQLASLRFLDLLTGQPTNAGVLLFAKDPQSFVPGAYVQVVAYDGPSQADAVLWEREIRGDFLSVCRSLDLMVQELARVRIEAQEGSARELSFFDYPPRALRELAYNAAIHRRYEDSTTPVMVNVFSDRLEISNPGGLYGELTQETLGRLTSYRNPVLAEAAKVLGYVNRFGRGLPVVHAELEKNGSPPARFETNPGFFLVTVGRRP